MVASARAAGAARRGAHDSKLAPSGQREGEEPAGGSRGERKRQIERHERLHERHDADRQPEGPCGVAAPSEGAGRQRRRGHPRRTQGRSARPRELGVQPGDWNSHGRREAPDVDPGRNALDAPERSLEQADAEREHEHEVHARHREEVREPAGPESAVVFRCEVALTEHQGARHRSHDRVEARVDSPPNSRASAVDPRHDPRAPLRDPHVERAPRAHHVAKGFAWARIARGRVPQALRGRHGGHEFDPVPPGEIFRPAIERGAPGPRDGGPVAREVLETPIPPEDAPHLDRRRIDAGVRAASSGLRQGARRRPPDRARAGSRRPGRARRRTRGRARRLRSPRPTHVSRETPEPGGVQPRSSPPRARPSRGPRPQARGRRGGPHRETSSRAVWSRVACGASDRSMGGGVGNLAQQPTAGVMPRLACGLRRGFREARPVGGHRPLVPVICLGRYGERCRPGGATLTLQVEPGT